MSSMGDSSPAQQTIPHTKHMIDTFLYYRRPAQQTIPHTKYVFLFNRIASEYFIYSEINLYIDSLGLYIDKNVLSTETVIIRRKYTRDKKMSMELCRRDNLNFTT